MKQAGQREHIDAPFQQPILSFKQAAGFRKWYEHFIDNEFQQLDIPWENDLRISDEEKAAISASIQEFQLGESSEGRHLKRKARSFSNRWQLPFYALTIDTFIKEENRHSAYLGRFMRFQGIPLAEKHWGDTLFRLLRNLGGLEISVTVLITAEIYAMAYYKALQTATESPVLKAICDQVLIDEIEHLKFQSETLQVIYSKRSNFLNKLMRTFHESVFKGANWLVWRNHKKVFRRAGMSQAAYKKENRYWWKECLKQIDT